MTVKKLSQIGELALLAKIKKQFGKKSESVLCGIGDDASVLKPLNKFLLLTTDMMVEGVHFDLTFTTPYQLGFKLVSVNVSDIYAMGGQPSHVLLNIAVQKERDLAFIDLLFKGIQDAMKRYQTVLIGGDLSAAPKDMSLSATLIGYADKYLLRSGANIGDKIYVTGNLGDSACGLQLLKRIKNPISLSRKTGSRNNMPSALRTKLTRLGLSWNVVEPLVRRHLMPEARNPAKFVQQATSMIDISDGLLVDLTRLCKESRTGVKIYEEEIPVSSGMKEAAMHMGLSPLALALAGGEDYELLFTAPSGKKVNAICIGDIVQSKMVTVNRKGKEKTFSARGYQHFQVRSERK
jgi:thiamine-monophosphate kinase